MNGRNRRSADFARHTLSFRKAPLTVVWPMAIRRGKIDPIRTFAIADERGGLCPFAVAPRRPMNPIEGNA